MSKPTQKPSILCPECGSEPVKSRDSDRGAIYCATFGHLINVNADKNPSGDRAINPDFDRFVNEEKNSSGAQSESPRPAQVEGLATARPWYIILDHETDEPKLSPNGTYGLHHNSEEIAEFRNLEDAQIALTAVNAYEGNAAKLEALAAALRTAQATLYSSPAMGHPENVFINRRMAANEQINAALALIESPDTKENT